MGSFTATRFRLALSPGHAALRYSLIKSSSALRSTSTPSTPTQEPAISMTTPSIAPEPTPTTPAAPAIAAEPTAAPSATTRPRSSTLDKLKSILHLPTSDSSPSATTPAATATPSAEKAFVPSTEHPTAPSPHDVRFELREVQAQHEAAEAEADQHIREREADERVTGSTGTGGPVHLSRMSSLGRRPSLGVAAGKTKERKHHPHGAHGISSGGLAAVGGALGGGGGELSYGAGEPDMQGVTRIPESELKPRADRMEHTATRPSDPNDPKSMDGAPDETSAGDDLAL